MDSSARKMISGWLDDVNVVNNLWKRAWRWKKWQSIIPLPNRRFSCAYFVWERFGLYDILSIYCSCRQGSLLIGSGFHRSVSLCLDVFPAWRWQIGEVVQWNYLFTNSDLTSFFKRECQRLISLPFHVKSPKWECWGLVLLPFGPSARERHPRSTMQVYDWGI